MKNISRAIAKVIVPALGYLVMRFYWYTSSKKFVIEGEIPTAQCVVAFWHGELLLSPQAYRHLHRSQLSSAIISRHFDGEMIARILQFFGIRPLRGSTSKGAKQVLLEAFRAIKKGEDVLVTPDGPRGPRHSTGDGAVALARKTNNPIMTVNFTASSYWQLKSWDHFVIPKPFCSITFYIKIIELSTMESEEAKEFLRNKMLSNTIL